MPTSSPTPHGQPGQQAAPWNRQARPELLLKPTEGLAVEMRRHMSTGQRAMASALVLAADGRRSNGRWAYGSLANSENSPNWGWVRALRDDQVTGAGAAATSTHGRSTGGGVFLSERDLKIRQITELADTNGLARDAGRDELRQLAKARGIKARTDVFAEVIRARKASFELSPSLSPCHPLGDSENLSPNHGDSAEQDQPELTLTSANTCPQPSGTAGDKEARHVIVPMSPFLEGDRGQPTDTDRSEQAPTACTDCRLPLNPALAAAGETLHPSCGDPA